MHRYHFTLVLVVAGLLLPHACLAVEKTIMAPVEEVNESQKTITVGEQTFDVTRKTSITINGEKATLVEIKAGQQAKIKYDDKLDVAISITVFEEGSSSNEGLAPLIGTWLAFTEETGGKRIKKDDMKTKKKTLKIDGDKFTLSTNNYKFTGKVALVPEDGLNAIDLSGKFVGKEESNMVLKAIFEINGKTLRLCYSTSIEGKQERERPTEFETEEGKDGLCVSFEKID